MTTEVKPFVCDKCKEPQVEVKIYGECTCCKERKPSVECRDFKIPTFQDIGVSELVYVGEMETCGSYCDECFKKEPWKGKAEIDVYDFEYSKMVDLSSIEECYELVLKKRKLEVEDQ